MAHTKDDRLYLRVNSQIKSDFEKAANYRGMKPAALLHSLVVDLINELKETKPQIFNEEVIKLSQETRESVELTIEQPAYQGKFDKKDKSKAS